MKKAVLLDIDGTLLDSWDFIFDAVKHTSAFHGYEYPSDENIKRVTGRPLLEFYQILYPKIDPKILAKTHTDFQDKVLKIGKPYPKTIQTLKEIKAKGYLVAAISNRARESLLADLRETKLAEFFDLIVSAEDVKNPKPHKEHILVALSSLEVLPDDSYMVGDLEVDILAGKSAKVKTVGVTYGFAGSQIKKYKPDFIIDDIGELPDILE